MVKNMRCTKNRERAKLNQEFHSFTPWSWDLGSREMWECSYWLHLGLQSSLHPIEGLLQSWRKWMRPEGGDVKGRHREKWRESEASQKRVWDNPQGWGWGQSPQRGDSQLEDRRDQGGAWHNLSGLFIYVLPNVPSGNPHTPHNKDWSFLPFHIKCAGL